MSQIFQATPYDSLQPGMSAELTRLCRQEDLFVFAQSSGNLNPLHMPDADGDGDGTPEAKASGMWLGALVSAVLGNQLPGPGTVLRAQSLRFLGQAHAEETVVVRAEVANKGPDNAVHLTLTVRTDTGKPLAEGTAEVTAPTTAQRFDASDVPGLTVQRHVHFDRLLEAARALPAIPTAVIAPEEPDALGGALLAAAQTLIDPILIGDRALIEAAAEEGGHDLGGARIVDIASHRAAAAHGIAMINDGQAAAVMKGHLHTSTLLGEVVKRDGGLRTSRLLSHVFVMDVPGLDRVLMITDAAVNIAPDLKAKADIVKNALDLALALGVAEPKVAVLSAVETVNPAIPSTLEAAALAKMAERGQIKGGLVDGPLAMDNAISLAAAETKGIRSPVAGRADVLIAPNMEAGNMIAKELTYLAHAESAGIVVGARCPVILTSRADGEKARLASCAVAALHAAGPGAGRGIKE